MKKSILISFLLIGLFSCNKEEILPTSAIDDAATQLSAPGDLPQAMGPFLCPVLVNEPCGDITTLYKLFGQSANPPFLSSGKVDKVLNCPLIPYVLCDRPCSDTILTFGYNNTEPWIREWPGSLVPCNDGVFSAAEQQSIVTDIKALALQYAPYCPNTNIKMVPIAYDSFWDGLLGGSGIVWYIGAHVKYAAPCRRTALPG